jgi:hypothetical protein
MQSKRGSQTPKNDILCHRPCPCSPADPACRINGGRSASQGCTQSESESDGPEQTLGPLEDDAVLAFDWALALDAALEPLEPLELLEPLEPLEPLAPLARATLKVVIAGAA